MRVSTGNKPKADQMPTKNGPYATITLHTARYQQVYKTPEVPVSTIGLFFRRFSTAKTSIVTLVSNKTTALYYPPHITYAGIAKW